MAEVSMNVPYREIQQELLERSEEYVKRIWYQRKKECLLAAGDVLEEQGYLPVGTTYEAWGDQLWFSVDKGTNRDLAHYFHEGIIYGPNFLIGEGEWRSPKNKEKYPNGDMLKQGINSPLGVWHWTEAFDDRSGYMYRILEERIADVLRR